MTTARAIAETERTRANAVQVGVVEVADYDQARLRVRINDLRSAWLPWLAYRAGPDRDWWAPEVGEQVAVACPDGDPEGGVVLGSLYQAEYPPPANTPNRHVLRYRDGGRVQYDRSSSEYLVDVPPQGSIVLRVGRSSITMTNDGIVINAPMIDLN